jgi:hypothetical protein
MNKCAQYACNAGAVSIGEAANFVVKKRFACEAPVRRLRPKLMTVCAVLASVIPILWASGIGSDEAVYSSRGRRNDYVHDSRTDSGSGVVRIDKRMRPVQRHVAARTRGVKKV